MSTNEPAPYDSVPGGQPGPYDPFDPNQQPGIPHYPGGQAADIDAYGQQAAGLPRLANWGWRALSGLIDSLFFAVPNCVIRITVTSTYTSAMVESAVVLLSMAVYSYMDSRTGQSPGKMAVGSRLLREADGQFLGFGRAFGRRLLHILDLICYVGFLWPAWDEKKQTFADKIVRSVVIKH
jgi:uncharacterized RDD family membrane protein YckC